METEDVLQVYVKDLDYPGAVLHPTLAAFARVRLKPGEEKQIGLTVDRMRFTSVDEDGNRAIYGKHFELYAGFSQHMTALLSLISFGTDIPLSTKHRQFLCP